MNTKILMFFITIHAFISFAYAEIQRCGTPTPNLTVPANALYKITSGVVEIPVVVHVIYDSIKTGNIADWQIQAQMDTLNTTYTRAGTRYRFFLAAVSRTENDAWHNANRGSQAESNMTDSLAIDPKHALNLYVINTDTYLGWLITWPWDAGESSRQHGVVIHYGSVPGGHITNFNWGYTATHEVGHYLGLYHTFQGGCILPGDEVDDTPYHEVNYGCPSPNPDTCPQTGVDPIHNYMNYTNDPCYSEFTTDQSVRMDAIVGQYKISLGGDTLYFTSDFIVPAERFWEFFNSTLKFKTDKRIEVYGIFDTYNICIDHDGASGTWYGISFETGSSGYLQCCEIKDSENMAVIKSGADVTFCDDNEITLKPGFTVELGGEFYAYVDASLSSGTAQVASYSNQNSYEIVENDENTSEDGAQTEQNNLQANYSLSQNYPNPFNPTTAIKYCLKEETKVTIKVYNLLGKEIITLVNETQPAGYQSITWNGTDHSGNPVPSGTYICQMKAGNFNKSQKMVLMK